MTLVLHQSPAATTSISAASLGSKDFKADYGLSYAYLSGAMYKGIASKELVVAMGRSGMLGYLGAGGMKLSQLKEDIAFIRGSLDDGQAYGVNLLHAPGQPGLERKTVDLLLSENVRMVEAAAFMQPSIELVRFRLKGARRNADGSVDVVRRVLAKVSRPEVARGFMSPPPEEMVRQLVEEGRLTAAEADVARSIPLAGELCLESDSGGHTDQGVALVLLPAIMTLRDELTRRFAYARPIRLGAAGGIGTPEACAAAFVLGADFVMTGSINQCTVEAGTSDAVKDMLATAGIQDTEYAPAGDMFELGARVQVLRKGLFFPARANKLYELYGRHASIEEIDAKTRQQIESRFFKRSFDEVWRETRQHYIDRGLKTAEQLDGNAKQKLALIFRWYFIHTTRLALSGSEEQRVDFQVHCGPAMGAFNEWVRGSARESWRNRHVAEIGRLMLDGAAEVLNRRFLALHAMSAEQAA